MKGLAFPPDKELPADLVAAWNVRPPVAHDEADHDR